MPTTRQLRVQVFTGIIMGATGVIYFMLDTAVGSTVVIAPHPIIFPLTNVPGGASGSKSPGTIVPHKSKALRNASQNLWHATAELGAQLEALKPAIFSPTSTVEYTVVLAQPRILFISRISRGKWRGINSLY
eukprot:SAG11_NODE_316_length_10846_cov_8.188239_4_plen_132_part_00